MNKIPRLIFGLSLLAVFTSCFALPPCKGTNVSKWNNCFGRQTFQNGDTYVGDYQDGKLSGQGIFNWLGDSKWKGDKYVGEFKGGDFNGQGTYTWANGEKYVGEYKADKATGQGTFFWANGERYIGEFEDGKLSGRGIYYLSDGNISKSGIWKDDELVTSQYVNPNSFTRIAKGTNAISDAELQRLENERKAVQLDEERKRIEEEKRQIALERQRLESQKGRASPQCRGSDVSTWNNCFGNRTYENGDKYAGDWQGGEPNGQGTFFWLGDTKWKGDKYVGAYLDGWRTGRGTYAYANGNVYVGEFVKNILSGQGTYLWINGDKYIGEYKDGNRDGRGIFYLADGSISQTGIWSDGVLTSSQYVDPNSFTRIAKGNSSLPGPEAMRLENERKAAQLEEEKRQAALERQRVDSQKEQPLPLCQGSDTSKWNNCFGTWIPANGDKYAGEFKNGKRDGQGTYYNLANDQWKGYMYVGEWKSDQKSGQGIEYRADGQISLSGFFQDGNFVSSRYVDPNSFTRIAKGNSAPSAAEAQRLENQRKAAQLEEERKKFEEEKRQAAVERQRIESQKAQPQVAPDNRRRLALVIGNDNYSSMPVLNNAVNDSKSMNDALKQANFEVLYYKNLNKRGMEEALYTFAQKLGKDDVGMFYFAGHGVQANGKNFLIPVAENVKKSADVQFEGIDVNRVMAYLQDSKNSLNIVVLDACRSSLPERGGMSRGLTVTEAPQGSIVAYATSPGKAASDGDGGNSPFTKNLIRVMQRKGVKIEDVFKEVRVAVARETNGEQVPQEVSQLVGDFYFRP